MLQVRPMGCPARAGHEVTASLCPVILVSFLEGRSKGTVEAVAL